MLNRPKHGAIALPFTLDGSLDSAPENPDIDFFKFTGTPGAFVKVALEGAATGKGTLEGQWVVVFDSNCNLMMTSGGDTINLAVPADGVFILAADIGGDWEFIGGGIGTYQLTLSADTPCSNIQNVGAVTLPISLAGSLDSLPDSPDIDAYRFNGPPGAWVKVELEGAITGNGTLENPLLGIFDSNCNLIKANDDTGFENNVNSEVVLAVPTDGDFIAVATSVPDWNFLGGGEGTYQMTVSSYKTIGSISIQLFDGLSGDPLPEDITGILYLQYCKDSSCAPVLDMHEKIGGLLRFETNQEGVPLEVGSYRIITEANQYQAIVTDPVAIAEGENKTINVPMQPVPIQFSDVIPCDNLPSDEVICRYSVRITNRTNSKFHGKAWSLVWANGTGSSLGNTQFQVKKDVPLILKSQQSKDAQFEFLIPSWMSQYDYVCTDVYVGQMPNADFNTVRHTDLFCITKGDSGFSVVPQKKAQEIFQSQKGQPTRSLRNR